MFKYHREFNCLNCLDSLATENNMYKCESKRENKDLCNVVMRSEDTKMLEFN